MPVTTTSQTLEADALSSTVVTGVVVDPVTGDYVREFRFFGEAPAGTNQAPLILTVRAKASDEDALRIATPAITI